MNTHDPYSVRSTGIGFRRRPVAAEIKKLLKEIDKPRKGDDTETGGKILKLDCSLMQFKQIRSALRTAGHRGYKGKIVSLRIYVPDKIGKRRPTRQSTPTIQSAQIFGDITLRIVQGIRFEQ
ncbi:MAG: hypothetical protein BWY69_01558 [Planctomycetes bacterium ADurb.Bin401]|nr:MAG: hypothetical protein BWY69_01558 [Planctomycetes bacterium ADurb.Bin401]